MDMKKYFETGLMVLCAAGFFGFIYPELCLTTDTVKVMETTEEVAKAKEIATAKETTTAKEIATVKETTSVNIETDLELISRIYNNKNALNPGQIRIRFRLKELINERNPNAR